MICQRWTADFLGGKNLQVFWVGSEWAMNNDNKKNDCMEKGVGKILILMGTEWDTHPTEKNLLVLPCLENCTTVGIFHMFQIFHVRIPVVWGLGGLPADSMIERICLIRCFGTNGTSSNTFPNWWFNGDLPWVQSKQRLKQIQVIVGGRANDDS